MTQIKSNIRPNNSRSSVKPVVAKELQESTTQSFISDNGTATPIRIIGALLEGYMTNDNLHSCAASHIREMVYNASVIMTFIAQVGDDNRKEVKNV